MASTVALDRQHESDSGMSCDQSPSPPQASPSLIKQEPREAPLDFSMKKLPVAAESGFRPVLHRSAFESLGGQLPVSFNPHMPHLSHTSLAGLNHLNPLLNPLLAASLLPSMGMHHHHHQHTAAALSSGRPPSDGSNNSDTSAVGVGEMRMTSSHQKTTRPFKAYNPADPLSALQIPSANSMFGSMRANTDALLAQYRHIMQQQHQSTLARTRSVDSSSSCSESVGGGGPGSQTTSTTPSPSQQVTSTSHPHTELVSPQRPIPSSVIVKNESASSSSAASVPPLPPRRKKELVKDDAYWERRRKNNDAAKRSRDTRRVKEDEIAMRAALLEQENLRLRMELAQLKAETEKLRVMLMNS